MKRSKDRKMQQRMLRTVTTSFFHNFKIFVKHMGLIDFKSLEHSHDYLYPLNQFQTSHVGLSQIELELI